MKLLLQAPSSRLAQLSLSSLAQSAKKDRTRDRQGERDRTRTEREVSPTTAPCSAPFQHHFIYLYLVSTFVESTKPTGRQIQPHLYPPNYSYQSRLWSRFYSSRRQESHLQRRRVTGAGAGARGCGPHHPPPVYRKSPARDESPVGCVVQTRQFLFGFSLRCVGFSRSSVLKFPFKGSW